MTHTPETPFVIEGVDLADGSRTLLHETETSVEARDWLSDYTCHGDDGGWALIEIYDTRGETAERVAFYESPAFDA